MLLFLKYFFFFSIGKNFDHWQILYTKAIDEKHANYLQLSLLKYAINRRFITNEQYTNIANYTCITELDDQSYSNYDPHTVTDLTGFFKICGLIRKQDKLNQQVLDIHHNLGSKTSVEQTNTTHVTITPKNIQQRNNDLSHEINTDKEEENINNAVKKPKKSRKRRKKKKSSIGSEAIEHSDLDYIKQQIAAPRVQVKVFTRNSIKKYECKNVINDPLSSSENKSLREIYRKMLKQFKDKKKIQLLQH